MLENPQMLLFIIPVLLASIVIHEMAHGYAALFLGDKTAQQAGRLTLNPLVHLDPIWSVLVPVMTMLVGGFFFGMAKPIPYNPNNLSDKKWGEAKVAIAGPLSNIFIAILFAVLIKIYIAMGGDNTLIGQGMFYVIFINIFLALLNMLPVPPLDGSKILFSFLGYKNRRIRFWLEKNQLIFFIVLLFILLNTSFLGQLTAWLSTMLLVV